jgi:hypothetical protein
MLSTIDRFQPQGGKEYTVQSQYHFMKAFYLIRTTSLHSLTNIFLYNFGIFSWTLTSFLAKYLGNDPQSDGVPYHALPSPASSTYISTQCVPYTNVAFSQVSKEPLGPATITYSGTTIALMLTNSRSSPISSALRKFLF